jgi:hypothetical protein
MRHSLNLREGNVLLVGKDSDVAKVGHEGVGIPSEEPHDLDISEPHGVENDTSIDTQGMGRPKGHQALGIGNRIKFANCACCTAKNVIDVVGGDAAELAESILADAKGLVAPTSQINRLTRRRRQRTKHTATKL